MKLLVIDDVPMNTLLIKAAVGEFCSDGILTAVRATEGIELAVAQKPDLIFLDLGLPDMDGTQAARLLVANPETSHIPVIAVTARAHSEGRKEALEAGCRDFITKPIDVRALRELVVSYQA